MRATTWRCLKFCHHNLCWLCLEAWQFNYSSFSQHILHILPPNVTLIYWFLELWVASYMYKAFRCVSVCVGNVTCIYYVLSFGTTCCRPSLGNTKAERDGSLPKLESPEQRVSRVPYIYIIYIYIFGLYLDSRHYTLGGCAHKDIHHSYHRFSTVPVHETPAPFWGHHKKGGLDQMCCGR